MSRAKRRILALFAGLVLALPLAELVARIVAPVSRTPIGRQGLLRQLAPADTDHRLYDLFPSRERSVWGVQVRTNAQGFRGRDAALRKSPGTLRIVAMGDSITFGTGLATEDTWAAQLERQGIDSGRSIEVLNAGVEGYDLRDSLERLEHQALALDPDIVVYAYCINDIGTATVQLPYLGRDPRLRWFADSALLGAYRRWRERGRAAHLETLAALREEGIPRLSIAGDETLAGLMAALDEELPRERPPRDCRRAQATLRWYTEAERIERLRWGLGRLSELGQEAGFEVQVVLIPALRELFPWCSRRAWDTGYRIVEHELRRAGLEFVNLARPFRRRGLLELRQERSDDIHPSAEGSGMIAAAVLAALEERGLLDPK